MVRTKYKNYSVTEDGRVFSHISGRFLKACKNSVGYPLVTIMENGIRRSVNVHRLVAYAFVHNPNIELYKQVNHIDGNRSNNHYTNLEWTNQSMNIAHSFQVLKNKRHGSKLSFDQAVLIRESGLSTYKLAKIYGVCQATIHKVKSNKTYTERYVESIYSKSRV